MIEPTPLPAPAPLVPPVEGWYYVTSSETGIAQWINLNHVMRMYSNGKGGTTMVFVDGYTGSFIEPPPTP